MVVVVVGLAVIGALALLLTQEIPRRLTELQTAVGQLYSVLGQPAQADAVNQLLSRLPPGTPPAFGPQITSIGQPNDRNVVAIHGRNFAEDCRVWFGPKVAQQEPGGNANVIYVTLPSGQSGDVDVCVQCSNGLISPRSPFTYPVAPPPPPAPAPAAAPAKPA
jgi:hypothetical protein